MVHVAIIYGFPVLLVIFEYVIRSIIKVDNFNFIGPTLASAALCYLAALTKPKEITGMTTSDGKHLTVKRSDNNLIAVIWVLIIISLFLWELACVISNQTTAERHSTTIFGKEIGTDFIIGLSCYATSLVLTFIKEKL